MDKFSTKYDIDENLWNEALWVLNSHFLDDSKQLEKAPRFLAEGVSLLKAYEQ